MTEASADLKTRVAAIEQTFNFDERVKSIEAVLASNRQAASAFRPWWRDPKTVTILATLIAAMVPAITVINGVVQTRRDSQRLFIEQQDKIRQIYLDRVLRPGITEDERARTFGLLSRLNTDPELQAWAKEELAKTNEKIEQLKAEKSTLEQSNKKLENQLEQSSAKAYSDSATLNRVRKEVNEGRQKLSDLQRRVGESGTGLTISCTPPGEETAVSITCPANYLARCTVTKDGNSAAWCDPRSKP
jgi:hypothetical protein